MDMFIGRLYFNLHLSMFQFPHTIIYAVLAVWYERGLSIGHVMVCYHLGQYVILSCRQVL